MSAVRIAGAAWLRLGVPTVVAGLVSVAALAAGGPAQASAAAGTHAAVAARAPSGGTWGKAEEVPGTAALNKGGDATLNSVSCATAGNCSAGGYYTGSRRHSQAFVVSEINGTWGQAEEVPGTATLNKGGDATLNSVSCATAGNCSAGGYYFDGSGHSQAFVVSEVNGTWGKADEVPGLAALNTSDSGILSVSCATAASCSAGGSYTDSSSHSQVFVVSEVNGTWGKAEEVPGTAALNKGGDAELNSVSCGAAGNCSAGGYYSDSENNRQAFVVSQAHGTWGQAEEVPGTAALNENGGAAVNSMSCAAAGNCSAGGDYLDMFVDNQVFVTSQVNGTWGQAEEAPGTAALGRGVEARLNSVSCGAAGNCGAGGTYVDNHHHVQAFVVSQAHGTWGQAEEVPGTAALNKGRDALAAFNSVSCATAGNCSAGGSYTDSSGHHQPFVVSQAHGAWAKAEEVPGLAALNANGGAAVNSVSCATAASCSATGNYTDSSGHSQAFVVNQA
jgi:D-alanine-D-alanine ligase-like ATP-grasp enzyme